MLKMAPVGYGILCSWFWSFPSFVPATTTQLRARQVSGIAEPTMSRVPTIRLLASWLLPLPQLSSPPHCDTEFNRLEHAGRSSWSQVVNDCKPFSPRPLWGYWSYTGPPKATRIRVHHPSVVALRRPPWHCFCVIDELITTCAAG